MQVSVQGSASSNLNLKFPVEKLVLDNGLTVLLYPDSAIPMISYHTWYRVGSRDESPGVTGAAHMLEHMMFKGAKKYSGKEFDRILHSNGIVNNAFTSWDYTGFYQNLPSQKLELMMDMEVDRMRFLNIHAEDLKSELQVVAEERRWRIDNSPMGLLREELFAKIFKGTPYDWPVIGHMSDITAYTSEKLKFFYDTYYVPNNAVLVLVGDFDLKQAKALVQKYYGPLPSKPLSSRNYKSMNTAPKAQRSFVKKPVQTVTFMMAYPSVTAHHNDAYALDVLAQILGAGASSLLVKQFVYETPIVTSISSFQLSNDASGMFGISVAVRPDQNWESVESKVKAYLKTIIKSGVSDRDMEKAKNGIMKEFVDNLTTLDGRARALATSEIVYGQYDDFYKSLDRYQALTKEDIQAVAQKYINFEHETFVALVPEKK